MHNNPAAAKTPHIQPKAFMRSASTSQAITKTQKGMVKTKMEILIARISSRQCPIIEQVEQSGLNQSHADHTT